MRMRKIISVAFVWLCLLPVWGATAQDEGGGQTPRQPVYALFYPSQSLVGRVATYYTDGNWESNDVRARPLFGTIRNFLALPRWSSDGITLYTTAYTPNSESLATKIYGYFVTSRAFVELAEVAPSPEAQNELILIESISPDNRYMWVRSLVTQQTYLTDITENKLIATSECPARLLTWLPTEAIISCTGELFSQPDVYGISLETGQRTRILLPPPINDPVLSYPVAGQVLEDGRYLVGPFETEQVAPIGLLDFDAYAGDYLEAGSFLQLNRNETYAAFFVGNRLKRLNLETLRVSDVGLATPTAAPVWQDNDTLKFWQIRENGANFEIVHVEADFTSRTERRAYAGQKPTRWLFAPDGRSFALEFQAGMNEAYVEVHQDGELLWSSPVDQLVTLPIPQDLPIAWSNEGRWLHLRVIKGVGIAPETLSVDLETGESLSAIETSAYYRGESPDGKWWLMAVSSPENSFAPLNDRLIVYDWELDIVTALLPNDVPLYINNTYPDWQFYVWSPIIQGD